MATIRIYAATSYDLDGNSFLLSEAPVYAYQSARVSGTPLRPTASGFTSSDW